MIAKKIRALIGYEGITQAELAKRLGKTPQNLYGQLSRDNFSERELEEMLMYGKEASNRKQEIDRQHYTIPNQRPKDKHCGKI